MPNNTVSVGIGGPVTAPKGGGTHHDRAVPDLLLCDGVVYLLLHVVDNVLAQPALNVLEANLHKWVLCLLTVAVIR